MLKVTLIFLCFLQFGCHSADEANELYLYEQELNKDAENRIDAAYLAISLRCDSLLTYELTRNVDSIMKADSIK